VHDRVVRFGVGQTLIVVMDGDPLTQGLVDLLAEDGVEV